jgi:hypothetical protein
VLSLFFVFYSLLIERERERERKKEKEKRNHGKLPSN